MEKCNEIFTEQRYKLNTRLLIIPSIVRWFLPSFSLIIQILRFKMFDLFEIKHTEFYYSTIFDLRCTYITSISDLRIPSNFVRLKFKVN